MPVKFNFGGVSTDTDTAQEDDVRQGRTFHSGKSAGVRTGTIPDCTMRKIIPGSEKKIIPKGSYIAENIEISGDANLQSKNVKAGVSIFGIGGDSNVVDTSGGNLDSNKMLIAQTGYSKGKMIQGSVETLTDNSFSPDGSDAFDNCSISKSAYNQHIGYFVFNVIGYIANGIGVRIANLLPKNIRHGVKIGGKKGYIEGSFTGDCDATAADILEKKKAGVKGDVITGQMPDRGSNQTSRNVYWYTHTDKKTYMINWMPGGYYRGWQNSNGIMCAEVWLEKKYVDNLVIKACIDAFSARGFDAIGGPSGYEEKSYTMPMDGTVYYGGASASVYGGRGSTCEIWKNDVRMDDRNINSSNTYAWRSTMFNKSFSAKKGDVIKVIANCWTGTHAIACIQAVIVC